MAKYYENISEIMKSNLLNMEMIKRKLLLSHFYDINNIKDTINSIYNNLCSYIYKNNNGDIIVKLNCNYNNDCNLIYSYITNIMNQYYLHNINSLSQILTKEEINMLTNSYVANLFYTVDFLKDRNYNSYFIVRI